MMTKEEIEEKFQSGFEHIKSFEALAQQQEVKFPLHLERIQALQFLVARLEELKVFELEALESLSVKEPEEEAKKKSK